MPEIHSIAPWMYRLSGSSFRADTILAASLAGVGPELAKEADPEPDQQQAGQELVAADDLQSERALFHGAIPGGRFLGDDGSRRYGSGLPGRRQSTTEPVQADPWRTV